MYKRFGYSPLSVFTVIIVSRISFQFYTLHTYTLQSTYWQWYNLPINLQHTTCSFELKGWVTVICHINSLILWFLTRKFRSQGWHIRQDWSLWLVPATIPSCELAIFASKSSCRDQLGALWLVPQIQTSLNFGTSPCDLFLKTLCLNCLWDKSLWVVPQNSLTELFVGQVPAPSPFMYTLQGTSCRDYSPRVCPPLRSIYWQTFYLQYNQPLLPTITTWMPKFWTKVN